MFRFSRPKFVLTKLLTISYGIPLTVISISIAYTGMASKEDPEGRVDEVSRNLGPALLTMHVLMRAHAHGLSPLEYESVSFPFYIPRGRRLGRDVGLEGGLIVRAQEQASLGLQRRPEAEKKRRSSLTGI